MVLPVVVGRAVVVTTDVATAVVAALVVGMAVVVTLVVARTVVATILVVPTLVVAIPGLLGVPLLFPQPASRPPATPSATRPGRTRCDRSIKDKRTPLIGADTTELAPPRPPGSRGGPAGGWPSADRRRAQRSIPYGNGDRPCRLRGRQRSVIS